MLRLTTPTLLSLSAVLATCSPKSPEVGPPAAVAPAPPPPAALSPLASPAAPRADTPPAIAAQIAQMGLGTLDLKK